MANVSITYSDVEEAASALRSANANTIIPAKDAAKAALDDAMGTALRMPETQQAIADQYNILHDQLGQLCDAIDGFAQQFVAIKDGMIEFDQQYAENIRNPK
ncbi:hypothetical protein [Streptomyces mayteni]